MIWRRVLVLTAVSASVPWPTLARERPRVVWVGFHPLTPGDAPVMDPWREAFRSAGYTDAANVSLEYRCVDAAPAGRQRLDALLASLVRDRVDILFSPRPEIHTYNFGTGKPPSVGAKRRSLDPRQWTHRIRLLGDLQRVIDLNPEASSRARDLRVAEEELHGLAGSSPGDASWWPRLSNPGKRACAFRGTRSPPPRSPRCRTPLAAGPGRARSLAATSGAHPRGCAAAPSSRRC
jgi:hypothetical protein